MIVPILQRKKLRLREDNLLNANDWKVLEPGPATSCYSLTCAPSQMYKVCFKNPASPLCNLNLLQKSNLGSVK